MTGMLAGVAAVICDVVITMGKSIFRKKRVLPIVVLFASFVAVHILKINIILIVLICAIIGAVDTFYLSRKERQA
jgi:chromate transporter